MRSNRTINHAVIVIRNEIRSNRRENIFCVIDIIAVTSQKGRKSWFDSVCKVGQIVTRIAKCDWDLLPHRGKGRIIKIVVIIVSIRLINKIHVIIINKILIHLTEFWP